MSNERSVMNTTILIMTLSRCLQYIFASPRIQIMFYPQRLLFNREGL